MSLEELIVRLRIEEDNRNSEKRADKHPMESKANVVERAPKAKKKNESFLEKVPHNALKGEKIRSKNLMANVTSVTKRDIGPKLAVAKAKTKEEQASSLLKPT